MAEGAERVGIDFVTADVLDRAATEIESLDVAVQIMLIVIWALSGAGYPWFLFALVGWGVGLAAHYAAVHDSFKAGS